MKQVTVGNNTYTSIAAAWRAESPKTLKLITVRWRLKNGWYVKDAFLLGPVDPKDRRNFKNLRVDI